MRLSISVEEKERRIAEGKAIREERQRKKLQSRAMMDVEAEKEKILHENISAADDFHIGLKNRLDEANAYLRGVVEEGKKFEPMKIPYLVDLLKVENILDARVAYKLCHSRYKYLIWRCWHFQEGEGAELGQAAFDFWDKMLSYPEVHVTGVIILTILESGLICQPTLQILKNHQQKFIDGELGLFLRKAAQRLLKQGGRVVDARQIKIENWTLEQKEMLEEIVQLFNQQDLRSLEQIADDSAV